MAKEYVASRWKTRVYQSCLDCIHYDVCHMRILIQDNNEHDNRTGYNKTIWLDCHFSIATVCMYFRESLAPKGENDG